MTNYNSFPGYRCHTGFTIKYNEYQYSWSNDTKSQRKYLLESDYCDGAEAIYVGVLEKWMTVEVFKDFLIEENYQLLVKEYNEKNIKVCPLCGGKLIKHQNYNGAFWGCLNYKSKNCKYIESIPNGSVK